MGDEGGRGRKAAPVIYISVVRAEIAKGRNGQVQVDPIRVARGKNAKPTYCSTFFARGKVTVRYAPGAPMPWGAKVWVEIEEDPDATDRG